jgi:hypothetical protein
MGELTTTSGFLIEKTFERMYREFLAYQRQFHPDCLNIGQYSTPRTDVPPEQMPKQYRGLQREPLQTWVELLRGSGVVEPTDQELAACLFMTELEKTGRVVDDIILTLEDALEVLKKVEPPVELEIIWARRMDADDKAPPGTVLLGYESNTFYPPTCDSPIAEGMFFTSTGSYDQEGSRFRVYHEKLNRWGLFDTASDAKQYLNAWLSFLPPGCDPHWYKYYSTEVRGLIAPDNARRG